MKSNARWTALALALLTGGGAAQDAQKNQTEAAKPAAETPAKKLEALVARFNKKQQDVYQAYSKAQSDDEKAKIMAGLPGVDFIPEFRALADEGKGTDTGAQAWLWILRLNGKDKKAELEAVDLLLSDYIQSPVMSELASELGNAVYRFGEERVTEALHAMIAESKLDNVKASALYTLGNVLLESKKPANQAEARDCLEAVRTEYAKLPGGRSTYGESAERCLFELDHLQIGMAAPDFEVSDENGVAWKLSDYKGKVVVIDFWGIW